MQPPEGGSSSAVVTAGLSLLKQPTLSVGAPSQWASPQQPPRLCDGGSIVPIGTGHPGVLREWPWGEQPLPSQLGEVPLGLLFLSAFGVEVEHARGHSSTWAMEQGVTATSEKWRVGDIRTAENHGIPDWVGVKGS